MLGASLALLLSLTRKKYFIPIRVAAEELNIPYTSLVSIEDFRYVPDHKMIPRMYAFFVKYPIEATSKITETDLIGLLARERIYYRLLSILKHIYFPVNASRPVGWLFVEISRHFIKYKKDDFRKATILLPTEANARIFARHLFEREWNESRQEKFGVKLEGINPDETALDFTLVDPSATIYTIFRPVSEKSPCYFAHLFLRTILKRLVLSYDFWLERKSRIEYLACQSALSHCQGVPFREVNSYLSGMGVSPLKLHDVLVLYGPEGDITLLTSSITDYAANVISLPGDIVETVMS